MARFKFASLFKFTCYILIGFWSCHAYSLTIDESRHLLSRTGFAPSFVEVKPYLPLTREQAVLKRIQELKQVPDTILADGYSLPFVPFNAKKASVQEKKQQRKFNKQKTKALQDWWLNEMLVTQSPFTENLTLFWHNHFVTGAQKVTRPEMMASQNLLLRKHSSGNFKAFLKAILRDPAMLQYLDNQQNRKNKPNENLAREFLELFTLGEGNYSETDIKQVARMLTGLRFKWSTGQFDYKAQWHDNGVKTLFGQSGNWGADQLVEIVTSNHQTARFMVAKLWARFITTPISEATLERLSNQFYQNYELKPLLVSILSQPEFWAEQNKGTLVKSPVQLTIGLYRQFEAQPDDIKQIRNQIAQMGQNILYPPNVKGWKTGEDWINTSTLLARQTFIDNALRGMKLNRKFRAIDDVMGHDVDHAMGRAMDRADDQNKPAWFDLLISGSLQSRIVKNPDPWVEVQSILRDASYQLQ